LDKSDVARNLLRLTGHDNDLEVRIFGPRSLGEFDAVHPSRQIHVSDQNRDGIAIQDPLGRLRTLALKGPNVFVLK
jgi:hypothetical protein